MASYQAQNKSQTFKSQISLNRFHRQDCRESRKSFPIVPVDPVEIYSDRQCRRAVQFSFFFFFLFIDQGYRCARTPPGQFKGLDPADWPRSILGADRMFNQDHLLPLEADQTPWIEHDPRRPFPSRSYLLAQNGNRKVARPNYLVIMKDRTEYGLEYEIRQLERSQYTGYCWRISSNVISSVLKACIFRRTLTFRFKECIELIFAMSATRS